MTSRVLGAGRALLLALALPALPGCVILHHPQEPVALNPVPADLDIEAPGPVVYTPVVSAAAEVPAKGVLNFDRPEVEAAGFDPKQPVGLQLVVHVLHHPTAGTFIVDTGVSADLAAGGKGDLGFLVRKGFPVAQVPATLSQILAEDGGELKGVMLTHIHMDHVLGVPDVPMDVPIYMGGGELGMRGQGARLLRSSYRRLFKGRTILNPDFEGASALGPMDHALDLVGDGSIILLYVPGHTPSSLAFLVRTTEGPVLLTGDSSHTWWGWEQGVEPGAYTADHDSNLKQLQAMKALAEAHPSIRVYVGHETDGVGTGLFSEAVAPWANQAAAPMEADAPMEVGEPEEDEGMRGDEGMMDDDGPIEDAEPMEDAEIE